MNAETPAVHLTRTQRWYRAWEQFWFRAADPTKLGLIRIGCGIVVVYTFIAYAFDLQTFVGPNAWQDLATRLEEVRERPNVRMPIYGDDAPVRAPSNAEEEKYFQDYVQEFKDKPPGQYPQSQVERDYTFFFRRNWHFDYRKHGMPPPQTLEQSQFLQDYAQKYIDKWGVPYNDVPAPAPPYPRDEREAKEIIDFMLARGYDPHRLLSKGTPVWSLWFYVTEPKEMARLHAVVMIVSVLFALGFCTRITSALTWFFFLNYVHRSPYTLFGADTMINILLLYLMIGPSGAALSVDRLLARWWSRHKLGVVNGWRALWQRPPLSAAELRPSDYRVTPKPLVGANAAIRLLQIHLCIIYFIAGVAKLGGSTWWNGTAVWGVMGNYELTPMQIDLYNKVLRFLAHNEFMFHLFLFAGSYFTLAFEIGFTFLIWLPRWRRVVLFGALVLHGLIGAVMGLRSFSAIMLVMNMAFLTDAEVHGLIGLGARIRTWLHNRRAKTRIKDPVAGKKESLTQAR